MARTILGSLPDWFARPDALRDYAAAAARLPTLVAHDWQGAIAGFITVERNPPDAAEVHVMAVLPGEHRRGCGRQLLGRVEQCLAAEGVGWLAVKTLAASHPDPFYARTRRFYEACGFSSVAVLPTLWGADTPCLLMGKRLS